MQRGAPPLEPTLFIYQSPRFTSPPHTRFPSAGKGPHGERCPHPETFLTYLPGSPVKELTPRPPPRSLFRERERETLHPQSPFISFSKFPYMSSPPGSPNGAAMERDARLQRLFYVSFRVPSKGALPPCSLHRAPTERHSTPRAPFNHISKSPVDEPTPGCPTEPQRGEMPFPRAFLS